MKTPLLLPWSPRSAVKPKQKVCRYYLLNVICSLCIIRHAGTTSRLLGAAEAAVSKGEFHPFIDAIEATHKEVISGKPKQVGRMNELCNERFLFRQAYCKRQASVRTRKNIWTTSLGGFVRSARYIAWIELRVSQCADRCDT